jgi:radical SAM superfamily enzyme YgiQ (UPF0313 family)
MAKILLIYPRPDVIKRTRFGFSLNLLYLSSILKKFGHTIIDFMDFSLMNYNENEINKRIVLSDYIIIEIDSFPLKRSINLYNAVSLIEHIKFFFPEKKVITFGHDLSLYPRKIPSADYSISTMHFETEILSLIDSSKTNINYLLNFDELPFPDRSILSDYIEHGGSLIHKPNLMKSTLIQTSRGCLNKCSFCQRKGWQKQYKPHSVDYVVSEFKFLSKNKYINIWIADDNFTYNLKRSKQILSCLIDNNLTKDMKISCSSWTQIDEEFLYIAKNAHISIISFGIETTDKKIQKFYNKIIDLSYVSSLIRYANRIGLYTVGNFIIGAPMETEETIRKTFEYALDTPFDQVNIKILDYMIGSDLFDTLPDKITRNKRHIFACKEVGLNRFTFLELRNYIKNFKEIFDQSRRNILKHKIMKYGPPYEIRKNTR